MGPWKVLSKYRCQITSQTSFGHSMMAWIRGWLMQVLHLAHSQRWMVPSKDVFLHLCCLPSYSLPCYRLVPANPSNPRQSPEDRKMDVCVLQVAFKGQNLRIPIVVHTEKRCLICTNFRPRLKSAQQSFEICWLLKMIFRLFCTSLCSINIMPLWSVSLKKMDVLYQPNSSSTHPSLSIMTNDNQVSTEKSLYYLGSHISNTGSLDEEISSHWARSGAAFGKLTSRLWGDIGLAVWVWSMVFIVSISEILTSFICTVSERMYTFVGQIEWPTQGNWNTGVENAIQSNL